MEIVYLVKISNLCWAELKYYLSSLYWLLCFIPSLPGEEPGKPAGSGSSADTKIPSNHSKKPKRNRMPLPWITRK